MIGIGGFNIISLLLMKAHMCLRLRVIDHAHAIQSGPPLALPWNHSDGSAFFTRNRSSIGSIRKKQDCVGTQYTDFLSYSFRFTRTT